LERRYQPRLRAVILREMETLEGEVAVVGRLADDWRVAGGQIAFPDLAVAVQRRILCDELVKLGVDPSFDRVELLRRQADRPLMVAPGRAVCRDPSGKLSWLRPRGAAGLGFTQGASPVCLRGQYGQGVFGGLEWRWEIAPMAGPAAFGRGWEWFDADKVGDQIVLRHWRPGDRFRPSGMDGPVKLQDLLTNMKISPARRRELVVATTAQGAIWWVEGLRIAEEFKLGRGTKRRLRWSWTRPVPGLP
jgi:tRNA(Ile)-lysidine synthetase-like protein